MRGNNKVWWRVLLALTVFSLVAAACGDDDEGATPTETSAPAEAGDSEPDAAIDTAAVGMALPTLKTDRGFSQAHYEGLLAAEEGGAVAGAVEENVGDPAKAIDSLRNLAADNALVIGVGAQFAEAGTIVAPQFADTEFAIVNGQPSEDPNLHVYGVRQGTPAYIAGVVAGHISETGVVGFIGGLQIPPTTHSDDGFAAGAQSVNPDIETLSTVTGDFDDVPLAQEAAAAQIAADADVIYAFVNNGLTGVLQAVEDSGKDVKVFGIIFPQCDRSPQLVGTATLNSAALVQTIISDHIDGSFPDGPAFFGLEDPNIQTFILCPGWDNADLAAAVADAIEGVNSGEITLPGGV